MKTLKVYFDENGVAREYDETYDVTIHCETEEEQREVVQVLRDLPYWRPGKPPAYNARHTIVTLKWDDDDYEVTELDYGRVAGTGLADKVIAWQPLPKPYREADNATLSRTRR